MELVPVAGTWTWTPRSFGCSVFYFLLVTAHLDGHRTDARATPKGYLAAPTTKSVGPGLAQLVNRQAELQLSPGRSTRGGDQGSPLSRRAAVSANLFVNVG